MATTPISVEQALFIASLPDSFCNLECAIRGYAFINRVAVISEDAARHAMEFGSQASTIEVNHEGSIRLAEPWRRRRDDLVASEGSLELAISELSELILKQVP